nr:hypothetical protein CFP56_36363 [Quercus suber]
MRAKFDRWLARPSTLSLLRQLIGEPCPAAVRSGILSRQQYRSSATSFTALMIERPKASQDHEEQGTGQETAISNHGESLGSQAKTYKTKHNLLREQAEFGSSDENNIDQLLKMVFSEQEDEVKAWVTLLEQQQRRRGAAGVRAVWLGMRGHSFDIPVAGELADRLWKPFISFAAASDWLSEVLAYAAELKLQKRVQYPHLYSCVVGYFLKFVPHLARPYHKRLREAGLVPQDAMKQIVGEAIQPNEISSANERFGAFRALYRQSDERDLYDLAIDMILAEVGHGVTAVKWHRLLIATGDAPSSATFARPDVQELFKLDGDRSLPMMTVRRADKRSAGNAQQIAAYPKLTRENMSRLVGEVHGIKPKTISDTFVAKVFATRAFSVEAILSGIGYFGIDTIGPLALRELAVKTGTATELRKAIAALAKLNIHVEETVFCRLLHQTATEQNNEVFEALLDSDQHHEVYEDAALQERILTAQLARNDWPRARVTLAVLELIGEEARVQAWNRVLQHHISRKDIFMVVQMMQRIQSGRIPLTHASLVSLSQHVLPDRRRGRRETPIWAASRIVRDRYEFVVQALMYAHDHGLVRIWPWSWAYLITTQGIRGRFDSVEKMVLKLAGSHLRTHDMELYTLDNANQGQRIDAFLSDPRFHGQLVVWGFRQRRTHATRRLPSKSRGLQPLLRSSASASWERGFRLVRTLNKVYGIPVDLEAVRHAFLSRMIVLFGPGRSTKSLNNQVRRKYRHSLAHYTRQLHVLWPELFSEIPANLVHNDVPENHPHMLRALFGSKWCINRNRQQYLDVEAWTRDLLMSSQHVAKLLRIRRRIPFTYYDNTALTADTLRHRAEYEMVLRLQGRPQAYRRWQGARRKRRRMEVQER